MDDMAAACLHVMVLPKAAYEAHTQPMLSHINVGSGVDISIGELAQIISRVIGFEGELGSDSSKPDGAPRKLMDSSRLTSLGWQARVELEAGLTSAYPDFLQVGVKSGIVIDRPKYSGTELNAWQGQRDR